MANQSEILVVYNKRAGFGLDDSKIREIVGPETPVLNFYEAINKPEIIYQFDRVAVAGGDGSVQEVQNLLIETGRVNTILFPIAAGSKNVMAEKSGWGRRPNETSEKCFERSWNDIINGNWERQEREAAVVEMNGDKCYFGFTLGVGASVELLKAIETVREWGAGVEMRDFAGEVAYTLCILFNSKTEIRTPDGKEYHDTQYVTEHASNLGGLDIPGRGHKALKVEKKNGFVNRLKRVVEVARDGMRLKGHKTPNEAIMIEENVEKVRMHIKNGEIHIDSWPMAGKYTGEVNINMQSGVFYSVGVRKERGLSQEDSSDRLGT